MSTTPKTIQIFLPGGDPSGIRIAEITTRIVQVIEVPRTLLADFLAMPEAEQVALYFLVGETEDGETPKVYIGQTGDLKTRLSTHLREKEFWSRALVLISKTNSLTQTHVLFLEWLCIQASRKALRYADLNGNGGSKPHTPAPMEADCREVLDTGRTLLATLGYPIFEAVAKPSEAAKPGTVYICRSAGTDARGLYTPEGFVVLKGSVGRRENVKSIVGTTHEGFRQRLLDSGVMQPEGDSVVFTRDHLFKSPSMAGVALLGRTCNGWDTWKTEDGRTLHAVERQETAAA